MTKAEEALTAPLCPTCGRRGSERYSGRVVEYDRLTGGILGACPSSFHLAADYGPMVLEALRPFAAIKTSDGPYIYAGDTVHMQVFVRTGDVREARKLLSAIEGRKGEET
jgi:hypothetical protein